MIPSVSQVLFFFSYLFSIPFTFVAEKSVLTIDLENKKAKIEYFNLATPNEVINEAQDGLIAIDSETQFDESYAHLKLTSKKIFLKKKKLNAIIEFSLENSNESLETLTIFQHPSGSLAHPILKYEKVISSNGKLMKEEDMSLIMWDKETKKIELEMSYTDLEESFLKDMVSVAKYWKKK